MLFYKVNFLEAKFPCKKKKKFGNFFFFNSLKIFACEMIIEVVTIGNNI